MTTRRKNKLKEFYSSDNLTLEDLENDRDILYRRFKDTQIFDYMEEYEIVNNEILKRLGW